ncbi:MAG TPA: AAA family ATPase [Opitutus sp.]|nr:AAA family ATPase [Opitutus sp.]
MIASVAFRNFKALRDASLKLAPFNLVLGPAGSGKTSLIEALLRLRTVAAAGAARENQPAGARAPEVGFHFMPPHEGIAVRLTGHALRVEPAHAPDWPVLREAIARIRGFEFDADAMASPSPVASGGELAPDGANLAAVLACLRERAPAEFETLAAEMRRIFPEYRGLGLRTDAGGKVTLALALQAEETEIPGEDLSQGTLHVLAVLTLAFAPAPPSVICLEEADRGVHPRMLREIRDALYRLSHPAAFGLKRAPAQVIATTHSPYLLDLFREHPEEVVLTQKLGVAARFERLADRADLASLLQESSLGDLWFSGILGGVPQEEAGRE